MKCNNSPNVSPPLTKAASREASSANATDSGLRENPVDVKDLEMGVGEHCEFVIDFNETYESGVEKAYCSFMRMGRVAQVG